MILSETKPNSSPFDRRSGIDRRRERSMPPLFSGYHRRHSGGRRKQDRPGYIDIYGFRSWIIVLFIIALSCLDAVLTAFQIWSGTVKEANPLMNMVISRGGIITFFTVKAAMTTLPVALIILHKEWKIARFAVWICISAYSLISLYHVYLLVISGSLSRLGL
jgi:hypothetical protein